MRSELQLRDNSIPAQTGAIAIEQTRAVAETQAAMMVAMGRPRDEMAAYERIMKACERKSLAATALYAYPRGGQMIEGPSIRLGEVLARCWGNITYGLRELTRANGASEIEAFAWDLESNTRVTRQFVVNHIRDKKGGGVKLTDERDIYELTANHGQRRVRACILEIIPGDIVEEAVAKCNETISKSDGDKPIEDRVRTMVVKFNELGVTAAMLEAFLGHKLKAVVPQQLVRLQKIYKSIYDGVAGREDFFDISVGDGKAADLNSQFNKKEQSPAPADKTTKKSEEDSPSPPEPSEAADQTHQLHESSDNRGQQSSDSPDKIDPEAVAKEKVRIDKCKTTMEVDKWRHGNANRVFQQYGSATADAILNHAAAVYDILQEEEKN